ncbi:efflux RND transporter periplasmic adaptor subunit [Rhizobium glycinendophyticum]|uniref:Efflux RND transporter periplasmic adaptor subunit n=1 Tax=Rhizobium glycinendophyticum TaxID=2589807 RepID=A0A504UYG4_9HYPH|nr:efflux RND transporter periplasmic adaptor subunit [Rhizobium glycinendophyticum]TPP11811.1 efflux RND transporter periplasmic adaptor subunit [Rhizobium glycinendophyticum]
MFSKPTRKAMFAASMLTLMASVAIAQETPAAPAKTPALPSIIVTPAKSRTLVDRIVATGTIKSVEDVYVQPQVEGLQIKSIEVDVGDTVSEGQVVARLNDDTLKLERSQQVANQAKAEAALAQYRAQVIEAEASLKEAQRQFDRATRLSSSGSVSASQREQAETTLASATAKVETAKQSIAVAEADIKVVESQIADIDLRLARTEIKSPVAGTVSERNARIGAIASGSASPLYTVIRDGQIELVADVTEADILRLKVGQPASISVAGSSAPITGSVRLISPVVDAVTRLGSVHIAIDDDAAARAGMYGSAAITIGQADDVALPLSAITSERNVTTVRLVTDGVVKMQPVKTGIQDGAFIEVTEGLKEGDLVVAKAGVFVRDGDRINPVEDTSSVSN